MNAIPYPPHMIPYTNCISDMSCSLAETQLYLKLSFPSLQEQHT